MKKNGTNNTTTKATVTSTKATKAKATQPMEIAKMKKADLITELKERMGDKFTDDMVATPVAEMREVLAALRQDKVLPVTPEKAVKKVKAKAAAEQTAEEPKAEPKKTVAKSKTTAPKEDTSVGNTAEAENKNSLPTAKMFKEKFEYKGLKFKAAEDLTTYSDVKKSFDEDEENLYITAYWTPQHIAQFDYKGNFNLKGKVPKKFEGDVDILEVIYVSQKAGEDYFLAVSLITGADYKFYGDTVEYYEDNNAGYKVRYSNTMEYEIYRAVE